MQSSEALQQVQAKELTLLVKDNSTGYFGVAHRSDRREPYQAKVTRSGKLVSLGCFATAEEAALCVARSPEGQAAAERTAASPPALSEEKGKVPTMLSGAVLKEEGEVPPMPPGAFVKDEEVVPSMPPCAFFKEGDVVQPVADAVVKQEPDFVVKGEERSDGRAKRQRY